MLEWSSEFLRLLEGRIDSNLTNRDRDHIFGSELPDRLNLLLPKRLFWRADACQIVVI